MKWSPTKEALDCRTNSPYEHLKKCIENGVENIYTDFRLLRVNTSELFYMVSKVILDCIGPRYFDLWLVQKPFLTNQMQNYSQSRPGGKRFPALDAGCVFQPCVLVMPLGNFSLLWLATVIMAPKHSLETVQPITHLNFLARLFHK